MTPKDLAMRVEVNEDGTINLLDFSLPSFKGRKRYNIPQDDVEKWIMDAISMLRITNNNDLVPNLGFKVSDTLYYLSNEEGDMR